MGWPAIVLLIAIAFVQASCSVLSKSSWEHYDDCAQQTASFAQMVECGKRNRMAACTRLYNDCSREGDNVVAYADSLAQSVARNEMSEAEARRRWIDFRMGRSDEARRAARAAAASSPSLLNEPPPRRDVTCFRSGQTMVCH